MLIERGLIKALAAHYEEEQTSESAAIIRDPQHIIDGLFDFVSGRREMTAFYIKALHAQLVQNQEFAFGADKNGVRIKIPLRKGEYKQLPNSPTLPGGKGRHEYCPPLRVPSEMEKLINILNKYTAQNIAPEVLAAWLHHRFTQIHPFQDGNGRVARSLATLIFLRANGFPLIIRNRDKYIDALKDADRGDLGPLVSLFVTTQQQEFYKALNVSRKIAEFASREPIKFSVRTMPENQKDEKWLNARNISQTLHKLSFDALVSTQIALNKNIVYGPETYFDLESYRDIPPEHRTKYWRHQISDVAEKHYLYRPNLMSHHEWVRLVLRPGKGHSTILVSFHGVGRKRHGVLACSVCFFSHVSRRGDNHTSPPRALTDEIFPINYQDSPEQIAKRFRPWLEQAIERGLAIWHESL